MILNLLVTILVLALVFGLILWCVRLLPLPAPFASIVQVAVVLILVVILLGMVFGGIPLMQLGLH
jgi:hypothetical protein